MLSATFISAILLKATVENITKKNSNWTKYCVQIIYKLEGKKIQSNSVQIVYKLYKIYRAKIEVSISKNSLKFCSILRFIL